MCFAILLGSPNLFWQYLHLSGLYPVWIRMWILSPYLRVYNFPHSSHRYPLLTFLELRSFIISSLHPVFGLSGPIWPPFKLVPSGFGVVEDEGNRLTFCSAPNIIGPDGFITGWPFSGGNPWAGKPYLKKGIADGLQSGGRGCSKKAGLLNISIWFCENAESCDKLYRIPLSPFSSFKSGREIDGNSEETGTDPSSGLLKPLKLAELNDCGDWPIGGTLIGEFFNPSLIPNVSAVKEGKLTGVSGVRTGWSLSGDLTTCKSELECIKNPGGDALDDVELSPPELCSDFGLSFIRNESVLKFERKGNWFMASERLLKLLKPFKPFKQPGILLDKLSPDEEWPPFLSSWTDTSDKKPLPLWWWLLVDSPSCFRPSAGSVSCLDTCIPSVSEFGLRNKVLILGRLFNGLFLLESWLVCECARWLWSRVSL